MQNEQKQTQTIVTGTVVSPTALLVAGILFFINIFLLGISAATGWFINDRMRDVKTELRIMQVHVQDMNAILLREGIKKPGEELKGPTAPN